MNGLRNDAAIAWSDCPQGRSRRAARAAGNGFHALLRGPGAASVRLALGPDAGRLTEAAPGLLWLAIVFGSLLSVTRLHQLEVEDGALDELARYPVERYAIYLGKMLAGLAAVVVLGGVLLPVVAMLYGINLTDAWPAAVVTMLLVRPAWRRSAPSTPASRCAWRLARSCCRC